MLAIVSRLRGDMRGCSTLLVLQMVLKAFEDASYDPFSIVFGVHMIIIGHYKNFVLQLVLALTAIVSGFMYFTIDATFLRECCYVVYPPNAAAYAHGGACNEFGTLAHSRNMGKCINSISTAQLVTLLVFVSSLVGDLLIFMATRSHFIQEVTERLESDKHFTLIRALMLFPITGIVLGTYERVTAFSFIFPLRLLLLFGGICCSVYATCILSLNYAWGCYPTFKVNTNGDILELTQGTCDFPGSPIYASSGQGKFRLWDTALIVWYSTSIAWFSWVALYVMRWRGVGNWILSLPEELGEFDKDE